MHDSFFLLGQIIFDQSDQLQFVVQVDAFFEGLTVCGGEIIGGIGEYPDGIGFSVLPKGYITIVNTQQEPKEQTHG